MADLAQARSGPASVAPPPRVQNEEDLTHRRNGPLGNMTVVPDGYAGPMPAGAVRETDYQRMASVYGNIESGSSSIRFDTSSLFEDADGNRTSLLQNPVEYIKQLGEAAAFQDQYMGYIQELVKTPAGLQMLETLDQSKFQTRIEPNIGKENWNIADVSDNRMRSADGGPGPGTGSRVLADPTATEWDTCGGEQPWMVDRPRFGFYHELVHAYRNNLGDAAPGGGTYHQCSPEYFNEIANWEFQAAGVGPYRSESVSENAIRAQMGVPIRTTYGGATHGAPDPMGRKFSAEELPLPPSRR